MSPISLKMRASSLLLMTPSPERGALRGRGMGPHSTERTANDPPPRGRRVALVWPMPSALRSAAPEPREDEAEQVAPLPMPDRLGAPPVRLREQLALAKGGQQTVVGRPVGVHVVASFWESIRSTASGGH